MLHLSNKRKKQDERNSFELDYIPGSFFHRWSQATLSILCSNLKTRVLKEEQKHKTSPKFRKKKGESSDSGRKR